MVAAAEGPLQEWAGQKGLPKDLVSLCQNDEARKWILDQLNVTAKESKLKVCTLLHFVACVKAWSPIKAVSKVNTVHRLSVQTCTDTALVSSTLASAMFMSRLCLLSP